MKRCIIPLIFIFTNVFNIASIDIQLIEKVDIDQSKVILERISKIAVTEDEHYIFPDYKAGNIKIFSPKGELLKVWGQKGMGPEDFASPLYCDYKKPYFILIDWGKYKLMLFERTNKLEFKKIREAFVFALGYDIKLYGQNALVAGYKKKPTTKNKFQLYFLNFYENKIDYILPVHIKYGCESAKEYEKNYSNKYAPIGLDAFFDYVGNDIYYSWEGLLRIIKINIKTKEMEFFGKKTDNYITPKATPKLRRMKREKSMKMYTERQKMSYVTGIFASEQFVGLTYANYDKKLEMWKYFVQLYKTDGNFIMEKSLKDAVNATKFQEPSLCYSKEKKILYFLSRYIDEEFEDVFKILKYKVVLQ